MASPDVIDTLVGIAPGSRLDGLRANRAEARAQAQASHDALFAPADPGGFSLQERFAIAWFAAGLQGSAELAGYHAARLAGPLVAAVEAEIAAGTTTGPYGDYPAGPLSGENTAGLAYRVAPANRDVLGARLTAALEHTHMLVFHPRDSSATYLQALLDAGWSTTEIVTLSQLVAFLAFQIRVVAGLRVLAQS